MENEMMEKLSKSLQKTRALAIFSSVVSIGLMVVIMIFILSIKQFIQPVYEFMDKAEPAMEKISQIDMQTINNLAEDIDEFKGYMKDVDIKELENAINNINSAIKDFQEIGDRFGSLFGGN